MWITHENPKCGEGAPLVQAVNISLVAHIEKEDFDHPMSTNKCYAVRFETHDGHSHSFRWTDMKTRDEFFTALMGRIGASETESFLASYHRRKNI